MSACIPKAHKGMIWLVTFQLPLTPKMCGWVLDPRPGILTNLSPPDAIVMTDKNVQRETLRRRR